MYGLQNIPCVNDYSIVLFTGISAISIVALLFVNQYVGKQEYEIGGEKICHVTIVHSKRLVVLFGLFAVVAVFMALVYFNGSFLGQFQNNGAFLGAFIGCCAVGTGFLGWWIYNIRTH